ncbi:MAG: serine/threonine protein kinase, partial [Planctomycetota bacterium]
MDMEAGMIGTTLGKYRIEKKLGQGGMGAVYLGYDTVLDRYVAIKILPEMAAQNKEMVQRFSIEAKAAAKLDHP